MYTWELKIIYNTAGIVLQRTIERDFIPYPGLEIVPEEYPVDIPDYSGFSKETREILRRIPKPLCRKVAQVIHSTKKGLERKFYIILENGLEGVRITERTSSMEKIRADEILEKGEGWEKVEYPDPATVNV